MRIRDEKLTCDFADLLTEMALIGLIDADEQELKFGPPCSHLISQIRQKGAHALAVELLTEGFNRELRLNGADLKIQLQREARDGATYFWVYIQNGHGRGRYTTTVPKLEELIKANGFSSVPERTCPHSCLHYYWVANEAPEMIHFFERCDGFGWRSDTLVHIIDLTGRTVCRLCEERRSLSTTSTAV